MPQKNRFLGRGKSCEGPRPHRQPAVSRLFSKPAGCGIQGEYVHGARYIFTGHCRSEKMQSACCERAATPTGDVDLESTRGARAPLSGSLQACFFNGHPKALAAQSGDVVGYCRGLLITQPMLRIRYGRRGDFARRLAFPRPANYFQHGGGNQDPQGLARPARISGQSPWAGRTGRFGSGGGAKI